MLDAWANNARRGPMMGFRKHLCILSRLLGVSRQAEHAQFRGTAINPRERAVSIAITGLSGPPIDT